MSHPGVEAAVAAQLDCAPLTPERLGRPLVFALIVKRLVYGTLELPPELRQPRPSRPRATDGPLDLLHRRAQLGASAAAFLHFSLGTYAALRGALEYARAHAPSGPGERAAPAGRRPPAKAARVAPATLLDVAAHAPPAFELILAALDADGRGLLRRASRSLAAAVGAAASTLTADASDGHVPAPARFSGLLTLALGWPSARAPRLHALAGAPGFLRLRELTLHAHDDHAPPLMPASWQARSLAAAAAAMPALRRLATRDLLCSADAMRGLLAAPWRSLESLRLERAGADSDAVAQLAARWRSAPALTCLELPDNNVGDAGAAALAAAGWRLKELDLRKNARLGDAGALFLAAAPHLCLAKVSLSGCSAVGPAGVIALAGASWPLSELDLGNIYLSAGAETGEVGAALAALSARPGVRLRRLDLSGCRIGAAAFAALASGRWEGLEVLCAPRNGIGAAALAFLPPSLVHLDLSHNKLGAEAAAALLARRWPRLEFLDLAATRLGAAGVASLTAARLPALETLRLAENHLATADVAPLARQRWREALELDLSENELQGALLDFALAHAGGEGGNVRALHVRNCQLTAFELGQLAALPDLRWRGLQELYLDENADAAFALLALREEVDAGRVPRGGGFACFGAELRVLLLKRCLLGDAVVEGLKEGAWRELRRLDVSHNHIDEAPTLREARAWAPALEELEAGEQEPESEEDDDEEESDDE